MSKETPKLISNALKITSKLIESDTNISTIDLNLLENLNTNQSLNYIKLEKNMNEIEANAKHLQILKSEFTGYTQELLQIENKVAILEDIISELDTWTKELENIK
ncbi:hypothetical protein MG5_01517 [Candida albicans P57072]|uniref:Uncharacterized protein n=1 Tax=Candida albicans (strain SC5314 / ATCC MYA-2876) TaxID=237561 RepID=A0A1D8PG95_CANAL|nr:uncharacterized protein CAALFM_C201040WA [Candida albicans SC5314]KGQ89938.1 hypothetical protein MEO_01514 [Candida albicans P94015]KGR01344.1 hypothetical protein MG1_01528 [Candida albicans GC75]KGR13191.1 hypothetical protein MG5_01517 [Candida albicans P57072]KGR22169.1 hypothetical protein MG9_01520 [Candida albicans P37037]KGT71113.1 hypothetical protein MEK_01547 [Candida albicans 12C]KGU12260.1 hypothetical protein MEQ_01501 [Candida albicans P87]KGU15985.1 hypothetical protein M|eukprot:XP_019330743.1 hypothetical protein CAALFM_C201040WA [Candida albicans SC5314]